MNKFNTMLILTIGLICFAGGAFVMENWHAERSALNAAEISELNSKLLDMETRQIAFMTAIEEHHAMEALDLETINQQLDRIKELIHKHDSGGM